PSPPATGIGSTASCTDQEWRTYCLASATTCRPSSVFVSRVATALSLPRKGRRDFGRRRPDHDRDLPQVLELDLAGVAGIGVAVDVDRNRRRRLAVPADTLVVESHVPLGDELAEIVELILLRLCVQ